MYSQRGEWLSFLAIVLPAPVVGVCAAVTDGGHGEVLSEEQRPVVVSQSDACGRNLVGTGSC